jgi:hypothetical protein
VRRLTERDIPKGRSVLIGPGPGNGPASAKTPIEIERATGLTTALTPRAAAAAADLGLALLPAVLADLRRGISAVRPHNAGVTPLCGDSTLLPPPPAGSE